MYLILVAAASKGSAAVIQSLTALTALQLLNLSGKDSCVIFWFFSVRFEIIVATKILHARDVDALVLWWLVCCEGSNLGSVHASDFHSLTALTGLHTLDLSGMVPYCMTRRCWYYMFLLGAIALCLFLTRVAGNVLGGYLQTPAVSIIGKSLVAMTGLQILNFSGKALMQMCTCNSLFPWYFWCRNREPSLWCWCCCFWPIADGAGGVTHFKSLWYGYMYISIAAF